MAGRQGELVVVATPPGIAREKRTVAAMLRIYCEAHGHAPGDGGLCVTCGALFEYADTRLDRCPYGDGKPTCKACPIHCYQPARREEMRQVMREAGPRMLWRHPWLAIVHLWKERFRTVPRRPPKRG
jgi:hypothetical protein